MAPAAQTGPAQMSNQRKAVIFVAIMLATFLTAMEATVVSTAMPTIIGDLQGISLYAWVFSAYLLASTATVPLYGRLADMIGRKPVMLAGIFVFLVGSALSGQARTMPELIIFRGLQGLGAGAVQPMVFTILGDMFTLQQRARVQGFTSAVWGSSSVVGPALGALITQSIGWRWVFYVNVPFGTVAMLILWQALQEHRVQRQHVLDIPGAVALTTGISLLLLGMLNGGQQGTIDPPFIALGLVLLAVFIAIEMRAKEPLLPLSIFREPFIAVPCIAGLLTGAVQFGISSYVPLFVQGVQLGSAGDSGKVLGSLSIGWPLASFISPRLLLRFGFRPVAIIGTACISIGTILLLGYQVGTPGWFMVANLFVLGVGLGFSSNAFLLAAQNAVGWDRRGVVTASVQFTRTIGGTLGVALLGAVLNAGMRTTLAAAGTSDPNAILNPAIRNTLPASAVHTIQAGLSSGLHQVYLLLAIAAVLGAGAALFFPAGKATSTPPAAPRREPETAATPVPAVTAEAVH